MHAASTASPFAFAGRHAAGTQRLYRELRHALSRLDDGVLRRSAGAKSGIAALDQGRRFHLKNMGMTLSKKSCGA